MLIFHILDMWILLMMNGLTIDVEDAMRQWNVACYQSVNVSNYFISVNVRHHHHTVDFIFICLRIYFFSFCDEVKTFYLS